MKTRMVILVLEKLIKRARHENNIYWENIKSAKECIDENNKLIEENGKLIEALKKCIKGEK